MVFFSFRNGDGGCIVYFLSPSFLNKIVIIISIGLFFADISICVDSGSYQDDYETFWYLEIRNVKLFTLLSTGNRSSYLFGCYDCVYLHQPLKSPF